jgi:hypothetical protein
MDVRFYVDPETDEPHIYSHWVIEDEVIEVLGRPGEDRPGTRVAIGQTLAGR